MKRSEKVEVRVSVEEKAALSDLAKSEGRPVSGLVRDILEKYMALNLPLQTQKPRLKVITLAGVIGLTVGVLAASLLPDMRSSPNYMVQGTIGKSGFGFLIDNKDEPSKRVELNNGLNPIYVRAHFTHADELNEKTLRVEICYHDDHKCMKPITANLYLDERYPSVWQTKGIDGQPVFVTVQALQS